jgi:hypothetical protein
MADHIVPIRKKPAEPPKKIREGIFIALARTPIGYLLLAENSVDPVRVVTFENLSGIIAAMENALHSYYRDSNYDPKQAPHPTMTGAGSHWSFVNVKDRPEILDSLIKTGMPLGIAVRIEDPPDHISFLMDPTVAGPIWRGGYRSNAFGSLIAMQDMAAARWPRHMAGRIQPLLMEAPGIPGNDN